jgi:DNA segregation ATPase FtsK/SpoIIIE, S-DNA-T family
MNLRVTVIDPQRVDARADVEIEAAPGTPLSVVTADLLTLLGSDPEHLGEAGFRCEGRSLDPARPLGLPPLLQGAVLTLGPADEGKDTGPAALLEAHVVAGPDSGLVVPLPPGRHEIGRGPTGTVRLGDPEVSRHHAELLVDDTGVCVRDSGSTNGTWLAGRRVGASPQPLRGSALRIGANTVLVRAPDRPPARATLDHRGGLSVNRAPRLGRPAEDARIRFPAPPVERPGGRLPWPAMLLPLLIAVPLAVIWRQPTFLLFAVMSPVLVAGQFLVDRRTGRHEDAGRRRRYETATHERQTEVEAALRRDAEHLEAERPDLARLLAAARTPTDEVWQRSPGDADFLVLRLGRGPEPARVRVFRPGADDEHRDGERPLHPDAPVAVDLRSAGVLGVCGPRDAVLGLARSLLGQIAVLHSPLDVAITVHTAQPARRADWQWLTWLPHHDPEDDETSTRVVVLDGAHLLRRRSDIAELLRADRADRSDRLDRAVTGGGGREPAPRSAGPGPVVLICLDDAEPGLPVECAAVVRLDPGGLARSGPTRSPIASVQRQGRAPVAFAPDLAAVRWAERVARHLAPLRDATPVPHRDLPRTVRLLDLLDEVDGIDATDPATLARLWTQANGRGGGALVGRTANGPIRVDLRRDGPHLLIGGTTGAGKSELLQTLVASLAVTEGPDSISFLLVDYKGGAAFRECTLLPQVTGVITDLDPHLAGRALASLAAELRRRERRLRSARVVDVDEYRTARRDRPELAALPRLVVVVDEFRVLAEELPDFVSGLVRIATVGRSLGVHLVLATQRPAGVVSAEITANTNLRIALRVRESGDSRDLIDDPAAAFLPTDRPGRALARVGSGPLLAFQTARVGGTDAPGRQMTTVRRFDPLARLTPGRSEHPGPFESPERLESPDLLDVPARPRPEAADTRDTRPGSTRLSRPSDLARIALAASAAARLLGRPPVAPPWLPPLPDRLDLTDLPPLPGEGDGPGEPTHDPDGSRDPEPGEGSVRLPFALADRPELQRQETLAWRLDGSHLGVIGGPRSGRTTLLETLARSAAQVTPPDRLDLYVFDGSGALACLDELDVVAAVVPGADVERGHRLLRLLRARIDEADAGRGLDEADAGRSLVVVLIDGWESLASAWTAVDHGAALDELLAVLRDGPAAGVHFAVSGGRTLLTGSVSALLSERVVLRFADPSDAILAGVAAGRSKQAQPPGRGRALGPARPAGVEIQVAQAAGTATTAATSGQDPNPRGSAPLRTGRAVTTRPGARTAGPLQGRGTVTRRRLVPALPQRLEYQELAAAVGDTWGEATGVPVGIGGDDVAALRLELTGRFTLVVGPPGSGRTSTLRALAAGLERQGRPVMTVARTSGTDELTRLRAALVANPGLTVLVDDAGDPGDVVASTSLSLKADELAELLESRSGRTVVAGTAGAFLGAYRGLLATARAGGRSGLLLGCPGPGDGEVLGVRTPVGPPGPPGRALLVHDGKPIIVQLALPPDGGSAP